VTKERSAACVVTVGDRAAWMDRCCDELVALGYGVVGLRIQGARDGVERTEEFDSRVVVFLMDADSPENIALVVDARRRWVASLTLVIVGRGEEVANHGFHDAELDDVLFWSRRADGDLPRALHRAANIGASRSEMEVILDHVSDAVVVLDDVGRVRFSNRAAEELFGRSGVMLASDGIDPELVSGEGGAVVVNGADGSERYCEVSVSEIRLHGAPRRMACFRDITERSGAPRGVEELRDSREAVLRALPVVMWIVDAELRVLFFHGEHGSGGKTVAERPEVPLSEFLGDACDEKLLEAHRAALRGDNSITRLSWLNRSWDVHVAEIERDSLVGGGGGGGGGEAVAVCVDVSKRERLQKALFDAQKLEAVGHLAGGVAHEINTPMQYVGDNLQFMEMALAQFEKAFDMLTSAVGEESPVHGHLRKLKLAYMRREAPVAVSQSLEGVARVSKIVKALKQSALMDVGPPEPTNLNHVVKNAIDVSQNEWKYTADVRCDLAKDLPSILGVPGDLTRAILSLVVNASDAIKDVHRSGEKGEICLRTTSTDDEIILEVQDDGGGILPEIRDKIFHQFFTTKDTGAGLGQGLTIARSIVVDRHGGTINFDVDEGVGTTFVLKFPRAT